MRFLPPLIVVSLLLLTAAPRMFGAGFRLFSSTWGDVIVNTDMTPEGRTLVPPTPEQPVYYVALSLGCKFGSIPGDREPDVKAMNNYVAAVMARQGYLAARPGVHEPALFVVVQWGYLQPGGGDLLWFLGYDARQDIGASAGGSMIGPEVFRRNFRSREIETVLEDSNRPIYGIIVTAFDHASASTTKPVLFWQTRIGLSANGKSMAQALPTMILAAGPSIGRETKKPLLKSADDAREGRVEFGDLEVIGFEEEEAAPPKPAPRAKK